MGAEEAFHCSLVPSAPFPSPLTRLCPRGPIPPRPSVSLLQAPVLGTLSPGLSGSRYLFCSFALLLSVHVSPAFFHPSSSLCPCPRVCVSFSFFLTILRMFCLPSYVFICLCLHLSWLVFSLSLCLCLSLSPSPSPHTKFLAWKLGSSWSGEWPRGVGRT